MLAKVKLILLLSYYYHSFILASCGQDLYKRLNIVHFKGQIMDRIGRELIRKYIYNLFLVFTLFRTEKRKTRNVFSFPYILPIACHCVEFSPDRGNIYILNSIILSISQIPFFIILRDAE